MAYGGALLWVELVDSEDARESKGLKIGHSCENTKRLQDALKYIKFLCIYTSGIVLIKPKRVEGKENE